MPDEGGLAAGDRDRGHCDHDDSATVTKHFHDILQKQTKTGVFYKQLHSQQDHAVKQI